ncbi:hypothetical protein FGO68_gene815 [Halteria grandinella]|uniref:Uncharacterized protein n=1 Tax=Halteria grandinella TaxID=5974 RepID=A0A8J8NBB6_HALGN|nr:hypothetical protein FGO68_gene815 [Halteria grandinella]
MQGVFSTSSSVLEQKDYSLQLGQRVNLALNVSNYQSPDVKDLKGQNLSLMAESPVINNQVKNRINRGIEDAYMTPERQQPNSGQKGGQAFRGSKPFAISMQSSLAIQQQHINQVNKQQEDKIARFKQKNLVGR